MHYLLIGFMGSGKSYLAAEVHKAQKIPLYCIDDEVQKQMQMSITQIFKQYGEDFFRTKEREALHKIKTFKQAHIIDCGGGTPIFNPLREYGKVFFLQERFEVISQRLKNDHSRPLFSDVKKAYALFCQREMLYLQAADFVLQKENKFEEMMDILQKEI